MEIKSHNTAIKRSRLSRPFSHFPMDGLKQQERVLDFGCGRGDDVSFLKEKGVNIVGYDYYEPFGFSERPEGEFDLVTMIYVVCTLPPKERMEALRDAWSYVKAGGHLLIASRPEKEVKQEARAKQWHRLEDGWLSSHPRATFQRGFAAIDLIRLIQEVDKEAEIRKHPANKAFIHILVRKNEVKA